MYDDDGEKNVCLELEQPKIKAGSLLSEIQKKKEKKIIWNPGVRGTREPYKTEWKQVPSWVKRYLHSSEICSSPHQQKSALNALQA